MYTNDNVNWFQSHPTPYYYYDLGLLKRTIHTMREAASMFDYTVHYAFKANPDRKIVDIVKQMGLGADCVSGNEVRLAIEMGFDPSAIVFAGVGKSDEEIRYALENGIFSLNCESLAELEVIGELAAELQLEAPIALRINPNVDPKTHAYITTGLEENKFGISPREFNDALDLLKDNPYLNLIGLHFHIGSQITALEPYKELCQRVNAINNWFTEHGCTIHHLNLGGGLGINYDDPDGQPIADFEQFFSTIYAYLRPKPWQRVHFELGRAIVGQCGNLISRVLYIKRGVATDFAILDAGMTELIRPALYQAQHKIQNLTSTASDAVYDVVGPICETSDCFGKKVVLPETRRGDLIAIRSAGAYGQIMASSYNLRNKVLTYYSEN